MIHVPASASTSATYPLQEGGRQFGDDSSLCSGHMGGECSHRIRIFSRARASTGSTSYFCVGHANIMCRKREA